MTTAHRPTFDHAKGKETDLGAIVHTRMLPGETKLKFRQPGQGGDADERKHLKEALFLKEEEHSGISAGISAGVRKRRKITQDGGGGGGGGGGGEDDLSDTEENGERAVTAGDSDKRRNSRPKDNKRRNKGRDELDAGIENSRAVSDARDESENGEDGISDDDDDDSVSDEKEDRGVSNSDGVSDEEDADGEYYDSDSDDEELLRAELEKIKQERAEHRRQIEETAAKQAKQALEKKIAFGNPLLNQKNDFKVKRSWTDETVFKNQASNSKTNAEKSNNNFVNDMIRSDFHRKFISKYIQ